MVGFLIVALVLGLIAAGLAALVSAGRRDRSGAGPDARSVRRFFQYALLYALSALAAAGVAGLVSRALGGAPPYDDRGYQLAQSLAFALVGLPLAALLAWWTRRTLRADPAERGSLLLAGVVTLGALTAAFVAVTSLQAVVSTALLGRGLDADGVGGVVAWTPLWLAWWVAAGRTLRGPARTPHLLLGSLLGLALGAAGLGTALGGAVDLLVQPAGVFGGRTTLTEGLGLLLGGALLWVRYWLTAARHEPRGVAWLTLVLVGGVGGGLVTALVAASRFLWRVLVWWFGDPVGPDAASHFDGVGLEAAFVVVGGLIWWYHRTILALAPAARDEVRRVHEYLVAGLGLGAAASGVGTLLVSVIEAVTPGVDIGLSVGNTLLSAVTLLIVGVPVWWTYWSRARRATAADPSPEVASPTRRVYLVLLFGVAGVAAVVALVTVALTFFQDLVNAEVSLATLRSARYGLGVLVGAAAVSAYHGSVFADDRRVAREQAPGASGRPRSVVLVGEVDPHLRADLAHALGARVEAWGRPGTPPPSWDLEALTGAVAGHAGEELLVLAGAEGPEILVVDRRGPSRPPG